jgi:hypothetical protein
MQGGGEGKRGNPTGFACARACGTEIEKMPLRCAFALLLAGLPAVALEPHPAAVPNEHKPGEVDRPEMVPFIVADPTRLAGLVVDETAAELTGEWQYSTHTPPYVGLGYLHDRKAGKGAKAAVFTPDLAKAGWYEVRLAHCHNIRRSTRTPVTVRHAGGATTVIVNQQQEAPIDRLWRPLGVFYFAAGRQGWVRVGNEGTEPDKVVIADAVQFLPLGGDE